jgi:hypothetical protein
MKKAIKVISIIAGIFFGVCGIAYYAFMQIDFIGHKDPKIIEENLKRWNNTILSAEYINGTDYCKVDLLDSFNIEINVGDKSGGTILNKEYKISNDTILIIGGIKHASRYLNSDKFLINQRKLLFKIDSFGRFDTITTMTVKFNKLTME